MGGAAPANAALAAPPGQGRRPRGAHGRWCLLRSAAPPLVEADATERLARQLLSRYGVVFRDLLAREPRAPAWRELLLVYRRLEARGEIRGGRFVAGPGGEHFALPEAVEALRTVRRIEPRGELVRASASDPANLVGIITQGARIPAVLGNEVWYRDGVPVDAPGAPPHAPAAFREAQDRAGST
jgi:ATP-dependent Lhr-like helicase